MKKSAVPVHFADLSDPSFQEVVARVMLLLAQAEGALSGLQVLLGSERSGIDAILRDGERAAVLSVLSAADAAPSAVLPLGATFSTAALRTRLERRETLLSLADRAECVAVRFADSARVTTRAVKSSVSDAYELLKPVAQYDAEVASRLAPAVDFYATVVRRTKSTPPPAKPNAPVDDPVVG